MDEETETEIQPVNLETSVLPDLVLAVHADSFTVRRTGHADSLIVRRVNNDVVSGQVKKEVLEARLTRLYLLKKPVR